MAAFFLPTLLSPSSLSLAARACIHQDGTSPSPLWPVAVGWLTGCSSSRPRRLVAVWLLDGQRRRRLLLIWEPDLQRSVAEARNRSGPTGCERSSTYGGVLDAAAQVAVLLERLLCYAMSWGFPGPAVCGDRGMRPRSPWLSALGDHCRGHDAVDWLNLPRGFILLPVTTSCSTTVQRNASLKNGAYLLSYNPLTKVEFIGKSAGNMLEDEFEPLILLEKHITQVSKSQEMMYLRGSRGCKRLLADLDEALNK